MSSNLDNPCICGHSFGTHKFKIGKNYNYDFLRHRIGGCSCNNFVLDSLAFIEKLAKEKGLV